MKVQTVQKSSAVAAAFLACIIVRVFFELQYYGPESAILRFNQALKAHDLVTVQLCSTEPLQGDLEKRFLAQLLDWDEHGVSLQVDKIERTGNEVRAAVVLTSPAGKPTGMVWVVQQRGRQWLVDVNKTATIFSDAIH